MTKRWRGEEWTPTDLSRLKCLAQQVAAGGYTWGFVGRQFGRTADACQQMASLKGYIPRKQRNVPPPRDYDEDDDPAGYRDMSWAFYEAGAAFGLDYRFAEVAA